MEDYRNFRMYCRVIDKLLSALIYISLIIFPCVTEIILSTQLEKECVFIMLMVCGAIQTIISTIGGFRLGVAWAINVNRTIHIEEKRKYCDDVWCACPTTYRSLFSAGYIIYFLPQWALCNMIIAWVFGSSGMPIYVHILVYLPLMTYVVFLFVGFAFEKAIESEEITCKTNYSEIKNEIVDPK